MPTYFTEVCKHYRLSIRNQDFIDYFILASCTVLFRNDASRNVKIPFYLSHTMYEVGTGWLIFTLYMVLFLLFFDLLKLCSISFNQSFMTSLLATFVLLGYGYYNYRHPKINTVNITLTKPLTDNRRPIKIVAVSDIHLGNGTGKRL